MQQIDLTLEFKLYRRRYAMVILFGCSQFIISVMLSTLNPIASFLCTIYGQTSVIVNLGGLLFTLMYPIFTFPASYVIDTFGTKTGITIGATLVILGAGMRALINNHFSFVIAGQIIAGIGRPFILNCQAKISANWFTAQSRGKITQILTLILNVSLVIGILIPGFFFRGYSPIQGDHQNIKKGKALTLSLMVAQFIMAVICLLPNIIFQQSKPPTPPSESGTMKRQPFKKAIPKMLKNRNFLLLLITFGCYFGIFNAISIILSYLIKPFFKSNLPLAVAAVGGSPVISGIIGVIVLGPMQRKQGVFKKWIIICMCGSLTAIFLFYPLLLPKILALACIISALNSFFLIPLVPIMLELGCQIVFPVGEGSAVGMLFAVGNFGGFVLGMFMTMIVKGDNGMQTLYGLIFCAGIFIIGLVLIILMKEERNRLGAELKQSDLRRSLISSMISEKEEGNQKYSSTQTTDNIKAPLVTIQSQSDHSVQEGFYEKLRKDQIFIKEKKDEDSSQNGEK